MNNSSHTPHSSSSLTQLGVIVVIAAIISLIASVMLMHPASAQTEACQGEEYTQGSSYGGGAVVYMDGNNYSAKWWTQQTPPGSEWDDMGACTMPGSGGGTTDPGNLEQCVGVPFDPTV